MKYIVKFWHIIFCASLLVFCITYFINDRYKSVDSISPQALQAPTQKELVNAKSIKFNRDGYSYTLNPLYDYTIQGLVLHQQKYDAWYSLSRTDKTFIKDLCVLWGKTLESGSYRNGSVAIKQDSRWCWFSYSGNITFNSSEISNNHLIASNPEIERQIRSISGGDQIRIAGKLVNVHAEAIGKTDRYESLIADWKTSTVRNDSGGGACEVIYVESIQIIKKGNSLSHLLFFVSKWILVGSMLLFVLRLFSRKV